jgi:transcriptional regulator with XRE-family HTH domain
MAVEVESFYADLGRRIRTQRARQHLTQQQLGSFLKPQVTRASIANIESGKQRVLAHTLVQMSEALKVPLEELLPRVTRNATTHIQEELSQKLDLPEEQIGKLVQKLAPFPSEARRHDERSRRTRRR